MLIKNFMLTKDFMLRNKFHTNLKSPRTFLTLVFYLPQSRREDIAPLIQFFQRQHLRFERLKNKSHIVSILNNGNFIAHSENAISVGEFEQLSNFLYANVIVIALFYQNQI